jgi:hypothetical protein
MAVRAAELDGVEPAPPQDPAAFNAWAGALVADLVEPARSEALDKLRRGTTVARHRGRRESTP